MESFDKSNRRYLNMRKYMNLNTFHNSNEKLSKVQRIYFHLLSYRIYHPATDMLQY